MPQSLNSCLLSLCLLAAWVVPTRGSEFTPLPGNNPPVPTWMELVGVPEGLEAAPDSRPVVIAVVDDAFDTADPQLQPFIWNNEKEIPGNRIDDDGNGHVDDVTGWDVADDDRDVLPPRGRESGMSHGTNLARIVVAMVRRAYGEDASRLVRILPVKCLEDDFARPYLKSGYKGIEYAATCGADIILNAWGEAASSRPDREILEYAMDRGCLLVAAAGNYYGERSQYPAAFPGVLAVASIDSSWRKLKTSSYGEFVDLVAPGQLECAMPGFEPSAVEGSSAAAAVIAGAAAILRLEHPSESATDIMIRLKNTARPVEAFQPGELNFAGKLGAGLPWLQAALHYPLQSIPAGPVTELTKHQGYLVRENSRENLLLWKIRPAGEVEGIRIVPVSLEGTPGESRLRVYPGNLATGTPLLDVRLSEWKEALHVPASQAVVLLTSDSGQEDYRLVAEYATLPIDQAGLYCKGIDKITTECIIEDGSGDLPYSPQSDCKWLITAPPGKIVRVEFLEFDTEANTDWLYFFNGTGTHERIMAVYSGPDIPPVLNSWTGQVLVWFVTDEKTQGKGWKAAVSFIDPPQEPDPLDTP